MLTCLYAGQYFIHNRWSKRQRSELLPSENLDFLNADEVAKEICPENIESVKIKAGKIVLERLEKLLNNQKSFAIETTLAGKNHIKNYTKSQEFRLLYSFNLFLSG